MTRTRRSAWMVGLLLGTTAVAQAETGQVVEGTASLEELQLGAAIRSKQALPELVADFDDHVDEQTVQSLAHRFGARFVAESSYVSHDRIYRVVLDGDANRDSRLLNILRALRRDARVEAVDLALMYQIPETAPGALTGDDAVSQLGPSVQNRAAPQDRDGKPRFQPNDPKYRYQWHLDQINMPEAWMLTRGEGVVVAVIDTGVTKVEDLGGTELVPGWNFVDDNADSSDDHGHGTHVAGTIAQTTDNGLGVAGVAPHARIMPIKVLSGSGSGSVGGIAEGIRWAADHGAKVINMSLGGPFNSPVLANAVRYAHEHGVVVVCAAGNDGRGRVSYPAANRGSIAVAATQFDETTTFYSNWGKEIFIAAPGGNTRIDQNGDGIPDGVLQNTVVPGDISRQDYLGFMGTSMASPHVAGVAALVVSQGVTDPDAVAKILKQSARRPKHYRGNHDNHYGAGIIDALAAVQEARAQVTTARRAGSPPVGIRLLALGLIAASLTFAAIRRRSFISSGNGAAL